MADIQEWMPVILDRQDTDHWLDADVHEPEPGVAADSPVPIGMADSLRCVNVGQFATAQDPGCVKAVRASGRIFVKFRFLKPLVPRRKFTCGSSSTGLTS